MLNTSKYILLLFLFSCQNQNKEDANILFLKGVVESKKHHDRQSIYYYKEAIKKYPDFADAFNNLGNAYTQIGNLDSAKNYFQEAIKIEPNFALAKFNLADNYFQTAHYQESIDLLNTLKNAYKDSSQYYLLFGNNQTGLFKYDDAKNNFQEAINKNAKNAAAYTNRGFVFYQENDFEKAQNDFKKALSINPKQSFALNNLSLVFAQKQDYTKALKLVNEALMIENNEAYQNNKAYFLLMLGKLEDAKNITNNILKNNPDNLYALRNTSIYELKTGNVTKAISILEDIYKKDASIENLHYFLGEAYFKANNKTQAQKWWKQAKDLGQMK